jgi:hypothetical protein
MSYRNTYRRSPSRSKGGKFNAMDVLPIMGSSQRAAAFMFFKEVLEKLGVNDIRSYFLKWRIPIAISVIVCALVGAATDGLKGFVIGGLLGVVAPIALLWLGVMLSLVVLFLAIWAAVWAAIIFILWLLLH